MAATASRMQKISTGRARRLQVDA